MKIITLFITFLCFNYVYAQDYIPMLQEGNAWSVDIHYNIFNPPVGNPCCFTYTVQFTLGGIVNMNGIDYWQILSDGSPGCLLREVEGIVYKYDEFYEDERVLFDFNLQLGDTFSVIDTAYDTNYYAVSCADDGLITNSQSALELTVISVDNLIIAGQNRKVITFDYDLWGVNTQWIEGIGNIAGMDFLSETVDITDYSRLVCFFQNGITTYFNGATSCDNTTLQLSENLKHQIVLYPNPITTTSILKFPVEAAVDRLKIFNLSGGLVRDEEITKNHVTISSMDYASGLYFYQVFSENKLLNTEKFIIQ